jgi:hypothetical protein
MFPWLLSMHLLISISIKIMIFWDATYFGEYVPAFQKNQLPPSSV